MMFSKFTETKKCSQKHLKTKHVKTFKKSCKEASNEKPIRQLMAINTKNQKVKKFKKSCKEASNEKSENRP